MVVYIDVVFLLNSLLDGLLLYFTGYLSGAERKIQRLLPAALVGGLYAALVFTSLGAVLTFLPVKLLVAMGLVWLGYGRGERYVRLLLVFLALSCLLAGTVIACSFFCAMDLYYGGAYLLPVGMKILLPGAAICFGLMAFFGRGRLRHQVEGTLVDGTFELKGQTVHFRALCDSGNTLCDPLTGAPVLVMEGAFLAAFLPEQLRGYLEERDLSRPEHVLEQMRAVCPELGARLLPYRSVGTSTGLLLLCTVLEATVGKYKTEKLAVALSPTPVSVQKEYDALWGGPVI